MRKSTLQPVISSPAVAGIAVAAARGKAAKKRDRTKAIPTSQLKLVIIGKGQTAGRSPTLIRLRPHLLEQLKQHATGPMYLLIELALEKLTRELAGRPAGTPLEIVRAEEMD